MKHATCPECKQSYGEKVNSEILDRGVKVTYECTECDHVWQVGF